MELREKCRYCLRGWIGWYLVGHFEGADGWYRYTGWQVLYEECALYEPMDSEHPRGKEKSIKSCGSLGRGARR